MNIQPIQCDNNKPRIYPKISPRNDILQNETNIKKSRTSPRSSPRNNVALAKLLSSYIKMNIKMNN